MSIELGDIAKDRITGFEGVVTAKAEYINGCVRIGIQPKKLDKDGKPVEEQWFDSKRLEMIQTNRFSHTRTGGGPTRESSSFKRSPNPK